jgi:hemerythrin-like domain-containing protein
LYGLVAKATTTSKLTAIARGRAAGAVAAVARRLPGHADEADPIALLEQDHRRFEALLTEGEETTERALKKRRELLKTISAALKRHEQMEEKILYPALKPHAEARDLVLEGYQEHHVADVIVRELQALPPGDERWGAKLKVLKENLEHHIQEEEGQMFPIARAVLDGESLEAIGRRMKGMKSRSPRSAR